MKVSWFAAAAGAALIILPAAAKQDPVQGGVEAWQRGEYKAAVEQWRGPAVAGNPDAQFNLGQAYKLGRGVAADLVQAEEWYRKAAIQGHPQAEDNYGLALFQAGKRTQALLWLEKSANRGEPRAQFVLGTMYFNGDSVERDWVRAYALMVRASQSGLPQASAALSQMDRHIALVDRQQGLALARRYEEMASRPTLPIVASTTASPIETPAARPGARPVETAGATRPQPKPAAAPVRTEQPKLVPVPIVPAPAPARVEVASTAPAPKPAAKPVVVDGGWRVQLGAFGDPANARKLWGQVGARFPGRQPYFVKAGPLTKLLVGPFASRSEANGACGKVSPCIPVAK